MQVGIVLSIWKLHVTGSAACCIHSLTDPIDCTHMACLANWQTNSLLLPLPRHHPNPTRITCAQLAHCPPQSISPTATIPLTYPTRAALSQRRHLHAQSVTPFASRSTLTVRTSPAIANSRHHDARPPPIPVLFAR